MTSIRTTNWIAPAAALALALTGCVGVPAQLQPAANEAAVMTLAAKGVQIYECRAAKDAAGRYEWAFVAPEADLFDLRGQRVGRHGAGPIWRASDGSAVVGAVRARADAPAAGAIPWLLLAAKPAGAADGRFGAVTNIQRVSTVGGIAPEHGCDGKSVGATARVDYTADYVFFTAR